MRYTVTFTDSRDFVLAASALIGAAYVIPEDALDRLQKMSHPGHYNGPMSFAKAVDDHGGAYLMHCEDDRDIESLAKIIARTVLSGADEAVRSINEMPPHRTHGSIIARCSSQGI